MHYLMRELQEEAAPKMNSDIVDGLATKKISELESHIDLVFRAASLSFPPGLEYLGSERCTPYEEYIETTRPKNNRRSYDIARSDIYMNKYKLRFQGEEIRPRFMYLPYSREANMLHLGGSSFHVSPVLSDNVISVAVESVFVRLLRDKLTFRRTFHAFTVDGKRESVNVIWSQIYRNSSAKKKVAATTKAESTVLHYLFARLGFTEAMNRLIGPGYKVGTAEITKETYPEDKWVICRSSRLPPRTYIGSFYEPTEIRIAVPRENWNLVTKTVIGSAYYLFDHFPLKMTVNALDHTGMWMILLGHIVFSGNYTEGKLHSNIQEHFNSLEEYVDEIISRKLKEIGYEVHNLYDLLILIMKNMNDWLAKSQDNINSIYNKNLEVEYYVVYQITSGIFRFVFNLNKLAARKKLTKNDVEDVLKANIKPGAIYKLTSENLAVQSVGYSGDNKYPKITAIIAEQESLPGPTRGKHKRKVPDITKRFHPSMLELGSLLNLPKSNPSPIARFNPYTAINPDAPTITPKLYPEILQQLQEMLDGKYQGPLAK